MIRFHHHRARLRVLAATCAAVAFCGSSTLAALAAPPSRAAESDLDPALSETELPPGIVEHGVIAFTITGDEHPLARRIEYWAAGDRYRSRTTDAASGELVAEQVGNGTTATRFYADGPGGVPRVRETAQGSTMPLAGWSAAYNRKLVEHGIPQRGALTPVSSVTFAGLSGTLYAFPDPAGDSAVSPHTEIAVEDGTFWPLMRQTTAENGQWGTFVQREELIRRDRTEATPELIAQFSSAARKRRVTRWRATVARARARASRQRG